MSEKNISEKKRKNDNITNAAAAATQAGRKTEELNVEELDRVTGGNVAADPLMNTDPV